MATPPFQLPRSRWPFVAGAGGLLALGVMALLPRPPDSTTTPRLPPTLAVSAVATSAGTLSEPASTTIVPRHAPGALPQEILTALREADESRRMAQLQAALRAWAATDLDVAVEWALAQSALHHDLALSTVIQGGANDPDRLTGLVGQLSARFPERAPDYGSYLIAALSRAHAHEQAAAFAATADAAIAPGWLTAAYSSWGRREPDRALMHLAQIPDGARRVAAFQAVISGWARTAPAELMAVAERMSGPEQRFALLTGMHAWIERDPAAAAAWIAKGPADIEWERILEN